MSYEACLGLWRNARIGHPYFDSQNPLSEVFERHMKEQRAKVGDEGHTAASKSIGWER